MHEQTNRRDRKTGYGLTFKHFASPDVSTEIGFSRIRGNANLHLPAITPGPDAVLFDAAVVSRRRGDRVRALALPRRRRGVRFRRAARECLASRGSDPRGEKFDFAHEFTCVANAGVNPAATRGVSLALDGRNAPYKPGGARGAVELNPLTIALGARFRM